MNYREMMQRATAKFGEPYASQLMTTFDRLTAKHSEDTAIDMFYQAGLKLVLSCID